MILPAIDLIDGSCVRLVEGDFSRQTSYAPVPVELVQEYANAGAEHVHVVDLDAARGKARQGKVISSICQASPVPVQVGGGVRSLADLHELLALGASRALIGSVAVQDPDAVCAWANEVGPSRIVLALDVRLKDGTPMAAVSGWTETSGVSLWDLLARYDGQISNLLVTDIGCDGMLSGPNTALYKELMQQFPDFSLIGSGGVGKLDHIRSARQAGCASLVLGKALFEGKFTLGEAIECWQNA